MTLSILIPTYNYDCSTLCAQLIRQAEHLSLVFELIVADDASTVYFSLPESITCHPHYREIRLPENCGRSAIRNLLADYAQYDYLLFLDSDMLLSDTFLSHYVMRMETINVWSGGHCYDPIKPDREYLLHWLYGQQIESKECTHFHSSNFLIRRHLFQSIRFDQSFSSYGHEDTLFGIELRRKGVDVCRNLNPALHNGLNTTDCFLNNARCAIDNLIRFQDKLAPHRMIQISKIAKRMHTQPIFSWIFNNAASLMLRNLHSNHPSLCVFQSYKLLYLLSISK